MNNYANALKEIRQSRGLSLMDVEKATGISNGNISRWENGQVIPGIDFCIQLAEFYGLTLDELVGLTDTPVVSSPTSPKNKRTIEFVDDFEELMSDRNFVNIAKLCKAISPELRAVTLGYVIKLLQSNGINTQSILNY